MTLLHGDCLSEMAAMDAGSVDAVVCEKPCSKCGSLMPADSAHFPVDRRATCGLGSWCRPCLRADSNQRRAANPGHSREIARRSYHKNREARLQRAKEWKAENADHVRLYAAQYHESRREELVARSLRYYHDHKTEYQARSRAWRLRNPDRLAENRCRYEHANPDMVRAWRRNRRARLSGSQGSHTAADERAQMRRQGGCCYYCGEGVSGGHHVDHVIPLARGGGNDPSNLVVACPQCNLRKHTKLPHEFSGRLC